MVYSAFHPMTNGKPALHRQNHDGLKAKQDGKLFQAQNGNVKMIKPLPIIKIFYCYASEDRVLLDELEKHLSPLKRLNQVTTWYDHNIPAGADLSHEIDIHLNAADLVLLLISPDFIHSNCHLSNKKYRLPNTMRRGLALSADGLCLIIWRDIIFYLCVSKSLVFLALFFGPMPLYVAEVPCYLTELVYFFLTKPVREPICWRWITRSFS